MIDDLTIILAIFGIIVLLVYGKSLYTYACDWLNSSNSKREEFVSDYYSLNWVAPDLTDYVNTEKVLMSYAACSEMNKNKNTGSVPRSSCTYSMSCDYTDDTAHPACFAGFDSPGDGDLDLNIPSHAKYVRNHSI